MARTNYKLTGDDQYEYAFDDEQGWITKQVGSDNWIPLNDAGIEELEKAKQSGGITEVSGGGIGNTSNVGGVGDYERVQEFGGPGTGYAQGTSRVGVQGGQNFGQNEYELPALNPYSPYTPEERAAIDAGYVDKENLDKLYTARAKNTPTTIGGETPLFNAGTYNKESNISPITRLDNIQTDDSDLLNASVNKPLTLPEGPNLLHVPNQAFNRGIDTYETRPGDNGAEILNPKTNQWELASDYEGKRNRLNKPFVDAAQYAINNEGLEQVGIVPTMGLPDASSFGQGGINKYKTDVAAEYAGRTPQDEEELNKRKIALFNRSNRNKQKAR